MIRGAGWWRSVSGRPVRDRVIEGDCIWLRSVLSWAVRYRSADGKRLLKENGTDGRDLPSELNPKRPIATTDRYEATRAASDRISMDTWPDGKRKAQRSYLSEILDIVNGSALALDQDPGGLLPAGG